MHVFQLYDIQMYMPVTHVTENCLDGCTLLSCWEAQASAISVDPW